MSTIDDILANFRPYTGESSSGIVNGVPAKVKNADDFPMTKGRSRVLKANLTFRSGDVRAIIMLTTTEILLTLRGATAFKYYGWITQDYGIIESYEVEVLDYANGDDPDVRHQWESKFENVIYHPNSKSVR